jgi:hypothetical protein
MIVDDIIARARTWLDDRVEPYRWSTAYLLTLANAAQEEACKNAFLLRRTEVTTVASGETKSAPLAYPVLHITKANLIDAPNHFVPLTALTPEEYSRLENSYQAASQTPSFYTYDGVSNTVSVLPPPTDEVELLVTYVSLPDEDGQMDLGDEPVIPKVYHRHLVHWIVFEALLDSDEDKASPQKAVEAEERFYKHFGIPMSAKAHKLSASVGVNKSVHSRRFGQARPQ